MTCDGAWSAARQSGVTKVGLSVGAGAAGFFGSFPIGAAEDATRGAALSLGRSRSRDGDGGRRAVIEKASTVTRARPHPSITLLSMALSALAGCAFELRDIVVDDARAPDAPPADTAAFDASDVTDALDATRVDDGAPPLPDVADSPDATVVPDVTVTPDVAVAPDAKVIPDAVVVPDVMIRDVVDVMTMPDVMIRDVVDAADVRDAADVLDAPSGPAGNACTVLGPMGGIDIAACGTVLRCLTSTTTPACSLACVDNASQSVERSACGGGNGTCLTYGEGSSLASFCAAACDPAAVAGAAGSCRAGFVCTGWWYSHTMARNDTPGCAAFCSRESDCPSGQRCNPRDGICGTRVLDLARLPDGEPCNPSITELIPGEMLRRNNQCRGICYRVTSDATQGICGSMLNLAFSTVCPDDPTRLRPIRSLTPDGLALCIEANCAHNADCRSPLVCRYVEDSSGAPVTAFPSRCLYATTSQPTGIP